VTRAEMKRAAMALSLHGFNYLESSRQMAIPLKEIDHRSPRVVWEVTENLFFGDDGEASLLLTEAHARSHEPSTRSQEEWSRDSKTRAMG
jgi:hypothetical protein